MRCLTRWSAEGRPEAQGQWWSLQRDGGSCRRVLVGVCTEHICASACRACSGRLPQPAHFAPPTSRAGVALRLRILARLAYGRSRVPSPELSLLLFLHVLRTKGASSLVPDARAGPGPDAFASESRHRRSVSFRKSLTFFVPDCYSRPGSRQSLIASEFDPLFGSASRVIVRTCAGLQTCLHRLSSIILRGAAPARPLALASNPHRPRWTQSQADWLIRRPQSCHQPLISVLQTVNIDDSSLPAHPPARSETHLSAMPSAPLVRGSRVESCRASGQSCSIRSINWSC